MDTLSFDEWRNWQLLHSETPIDDLHTHHLPAAVIAAVVANANRDPKKKREPFTERDFLPPWHDLCNGPAEPAPDLAAKLDQVVDLVNT